MRVNPKNSTQKFKETAADYELFVINAFQPFLEDWKHWRFLLGQAERILVCKFEGPNSFDERYAPFAWAEFRMVVKTIKDFYYGSLLGKLGGECLEQIFDGWEAQYEYQEEIDEHDVWEFQRLDSPKHCTIGFEFVYIGPKTKSETKLITNDPTGKSSKFATPLTVAGVKASLSDLHWSVINPTMSRTFYPHHKMNSWSCMRQMGNHLRHSVKVASAVLKIVRRKAEQVKSVHDDMNWHV